MAIDFSIYITKRNAPYIIWTVIAIVCALFFLLSSRAVPKSNGGPSKMQQRRRVSISLDGLLLGLSDSGPAIANFLEICQCCEVFAFGLADSDDREEKVWRMFESLGAFQAGFKRHRLMFSSTSEGRASMVRQLQPDLHLEASPEVAEALLGKVPEVRLVEALPSVKEVL
ncbi:PEX22 [Symbiodinium natans]|uniref:PEX22 protein n=1 Tax=Symbiodinium natans TaxID=878477 RepID=A0A812TFH6_9DINO|nr:PEX22 [Symbiodinium natans]